MLLIPFVPGKITTNIPQRLDRLPWSWFHLLWVIAMGIKWILDGLEVTIVGSIGAATAAVSDPGVELECPRVTQANPPRYDSAAGGPGAVSDLSSALLNLYGRLSPPVPWECEPPLRPASEAFSLSSAGLPPC